MTHTPGPWALKDNNEQVMGRSVFGRTLPNATGEQVVAYIGAPHGKEYRQERQANARLIAAAPELLDALQKLVAFMADDEPYDDPISATLFDKAINAIAKAIGE